MNQVLSLSWITLLLVGLAGLALMSAGIYLSKSKFEDKKDALGVNFSERSVFLILNGLGLMGASLIAALLKANAL